MVGALSVVGSSVVDSHTSPCLCVDALPTSNINLKNSGELSFLPRNSVKRKQQHTIRPPSSSLELGTCFLDSWHDWRSSSKAISGIVSNRTSRKLRKDKRFVVVSELGGQYEDTFNDVKLQVQNYFTIKAVRTVLHQLYEMNPNKYRWFYDFILKNKPGDGKRFLRQLVKERQDLAERVMVTRLHLYGKWIKKCDHSEIYQQISDENLALMRERLIETVVWPSDDSSTEKIG